jgi:hypothetical protein
MGCAQYANKLRLTNCVQEHDYMRKSINNPYFIHRKKRRERIK